MTNEDTKRVDRDNEVNIRSPKPGGIDDKAQAERRRRPDESDEQHASRREGDRSGGDEHGFEQDRRNP